MYANTMRSSNTNRVYKKDSLVFKLRSNNREKAPFEALLNSGFGAHGAPLNEKGKLRVFKIRWFEKLMLPREDSVGTFNALCSCHSQRKLAICDTVVPTTSPEKA
jgi:hypothetical protein